MEADDYAPISALQHLLVCERQAALIHVERIWLEDGSTASGRLAHARVDEGGAGVLRGVRVIRGARLVSHQLRLVGRADAIEVRDGQRQKYLPVEYKRGAGRFPIADAVQLAAQAMCIEEMYGTQVERAAIFATASRKRREVAIDAELRERVTDAVRRLHEMLRSCELPQAVLKPVCRRCSLKPACMPEALRARERGSRFIGDLLLRDARCLTS